MSPENSGRTSPVLAAYPQAATYSRTYDCSCRLLSESVDDASSFVRRTEFDGDPAGNRTALRKYESTALKETITYKPASKLNQMLGWSCGSTNTIYVHDANGCRTDYIEIVGTTKDTKHTKYEYDEDNRLVSVTTRETEIPKTYSFAYDYRTRRISRETPAEKTIHVFDGGLAVQEYDASQSLTPNAQSLSSESIRGEGMGGGVGGMVYSIRNGQLEASHSNHRGDVFARTDNAGNLVWFSRYNAYGTRFDEFGATYDRQRGNTKDEETPLGYIDDGMRPRDLEHGCYFTRDPIGFGDGPNLYLYVHCNPIAQFDALGLEAGTVTYRSPTMTFMLPGHYAMAGRFDSAQRNAMINYANNIGPAKVNAAMVLDAGAAAAVSPPLAAYIAGEMIEERVDQAAGIPLSLATAVIDPKEIVEHGIKKLAREASQATLEKGARETAEQATKNRVKLRISTKDQIKENQPRNSTGEMIDPNTKQPLKPDEIDVGHKPGQEWRKRKEMHNERGSTRKEVLDQENNADLYHLEDKSSNRSHKHEKK